MSHACLPQTGFCMQPPHCYCQCNVCGAARFMFRARGGWRAWLAECAYVTERVHSTVGRDSICPAMGNGYAALLIPVVSARTTEK